MQGWNLLCHINHFKMLEVGMKPVGIKKVYDSKATRKHAIKSENIFSRKTYHKVALKPTCINHTTTHIINYIINCKVNFHHGVVAFYIMRCLFFVLNFVALLLSLCSLLLWLAVFSVKIINCYINFKLTLYQTMSVSCRNKPIDLQSKLIDWFLYERVISR